MSVEKATSRRYKLVFSLVPSSNEFTLFAIKKYYAVISMLYFHVPSERQEKTFLCCLEKTQKVLIVFYKRLNC